MLWLRERGIDTVLTDGMFESNRRDRTTRHPEAATSPDGKVFISSEATLSEAELSRHEAVHVLEMKGKPLYSDYYDELQGLLLINSEHYRALAKEINKQYYNGKLDIEDIDSVYPISRELFAYVHQFIQTDPTWASERFSGAFSDWDGVVEASRRLAQGLENQGAAGDAQGNGNPSRKEPAEVRGEFSRLYAPDSGTSERLQAMAAGYDADTAEAFAAGYDGTLPLTSYQTAFDYFRTQAKQGIPLETAEKNGGLLGQLLAPESRRTAYQAGLRESAGHGNIKMDAEGLETDRQRDDTGEKSEIKKGGTAPDFYIGPNGKVLPNQYKDWIGTNIQKELLDQAENPQLQNAIKQLYRGNSFIGDGGTADAIRFEQQIGLMLGKKGGSHVQKGIDMAKYIENKILTQNLSPSDRALATQLLEDLYRALGR